MNLARIIWMTTAFIAGSAVSNAQHSFSDISTPHFRIRFQEGILRTQARTVGEYLEQDFGYLRKALSLEPGRIIEFRLYDSQPAFRSGTGNRRAERVETKRGIVHVSPVGPLEANGELAQTLSLGLSQVMLERSMNNGAPRWLVGAFALYHSGLMADLSVPVGRVLSHFSDLDQELQDASGPSGRDRMNYLLGVTMKFFVETFGENQTFGLFAVFDGAKTIEMVFVEILARPYEDVERLWGSYIATALNGRSGVQQRRE